MQAQDFGYCLLLRSWCFLPGAAFLVLTSWCCRPGAAFLVPQREEGKPDIDNDQLIQSVQERAALWDPLIVIILTRHGFDDSGKKWQDRCWLIGMVPRHMPERNFPIETIKSKGKVSEKCKAIRMSYGKLGGRKSHHCIIIAKHDQILFTLASHLSLFFNRFHSTGLSYAALHLELLIGKSNICDIVLSTCSTIWSRLHQIVLPEPKMEDWLRIAHGFQDMCQFPNCIGALDGKHIRVRKPPNSGSQFYNYKQFFSVMLLVLVDSRYRFVIVDIGAYGRTGDSRVFNSSIMGQRLRNNQFDLPPLRHLPGSTMDAVHYVIVGDEAFQLTRNVMRPYPRRYLSHQRRSFYFRLSRARRLVEYTFGILCAKRRILQSAIQLSEENVNLVIQACVILHNFTRIHDCAAYDGEELVVPNIVAPRPPIIPPRRQPSGLKVHDVFTRYFVSPVGSTPWQQNALLSL
ncbi:uncharacterized protein [Dendrobates tinctorius]|uniref:uncharacterized protein n=1 Tax=Dendrobates tinctorius TaxID=92724 RepID=UPI003CC9C331